MTIVPAQHDNIPRQRERSHAQPLGPRPQRSLSMLNERVFPALRALVRMGYFSLEVEGAENVPTRGGAIYVGNHAGWFTLDTLMGAVAVTDHVGIDRLPWGAVQDQLLRTPKVGTFFQKVGGFPASWLRTPERIPSDMEVFSIYPEGAEGNCKSFLHAYRMREWRTGFLRIAVARGAPIVPIAIIGGEECLPSLSTITAGRSLLGTILPVPLAVVPLPARWKFVFLPPVWLTEDDLGGADADVETKRARSREVAAHIRALVQRVIDRETHNHVLVRLSKWVHGAFGSVAQSSENVAAAVVT